MALISTSVRRVAAVNLLAEGSRYGRFRFLSDQLSVSTRWLHKLDRGLRQSLFPEARPSPLSSRSMSRDSDMRPSDGLDRQEVSRRLIACLGAQGTSTRDILETLWEVLKVHRGHSAIAEDIRSLGCKAEKLLDGLHMEEKVTLLAPDEVYSGDKAVLMTVEPRSLAWLSADLLASFDASDWATRFLYFPHLKDAVADRGTALCKGLDMVGARHRPDHFHAVKLLQESIRKLEREAFRWIGLEYESEKRQKKLRRKMKDQRVASVQRMVWTRKAEAAMLRHDLVLWLTEEIRRILAGQDPSGHRMSAEEAREELEVALVLLAQLHVPKWKSIRAYLEPKSVLAFLDDLQDGTQDPIRASSCVETVNSFVRMDQQGKKGLTQEYLHLARWRYNLRAFSTGKRKGKCPAELLGVKNLPDSWVTAVLN